jgi:hypothetical protein
MLQMQGYVTYIAAMTQQAQQAQGQPNDFHLQLPPASHQPAISPPPPAEIVTLDDGEAGAQRPLGEKIEPRAEKQPHENRQLDGADAVEPSNEDLSRIGDGQSLVKTNDTPVEQPSSTPSAQTISDDTILHSSAPPIPPLRPPTTTPQTILPFAPQPLHGTFPGSGIPMALHSPFLLSHHHPGTPNPMSPLMSSGPHSPFAFPPPHHHPFGSQQQHQQQPHPHYPFMALGLSGGPGMAGHMQPMQSPILHPHGGMMMMSPHGGFNGLPPSSPFAPGLPGSPTMSSFRPMTPATHGAIPSNMGIGMGNGGGGMQSHGSASASPLWMNGFMSASNASGGGAASASSKLSMSPTSGPSSPLPPYLQSERGRKGWQGQQTRSRPNSMLGGLKGELDELDGVPQEGEGRGDVDDVGNDLDDDDDEESLNPMLADAILKRPSSIRMNSKRSSSNFARDVGLAGSVSMPGMANGASGRPAVSPAFPSAFTNEEASHQEQQPSPPLRHSQDEVEEEFTFPSLSELGNVAREKRVGTPGEKNARSTALAMSPSATAQQVVGKKTDEDSLEAHSIP